MFGLNELEIEAYKEDVCKIDCTKHANDLDIAQEIWKMTAKKVLDGVSNMEGWEMVQDGLSLKNDIVFFNVLFTEDKEIIETSSSDDQTDKNTTLEMSEEG